MSAAQQVVGRPTDEAVPARKPASTWPLPALLTWAMAWAVFLSAQHLGAPLWLALAAGVSAGAWPASRQATRWRRLIVAGGFPVSVLASGSTLHAPAWAWLLPLAALLIAYPRKAWRDAPFFPTPAGALNRLPVLVPLADGTRVLDAGCGLGHGLRALRQAYPQAQVEGVEWSPLLAWAAARLCPWATVRRGDLWAGSWQSYGLVYLFQRPESMVKAVDKARREMRPGSWLASLEFEAEGVAAQARLDGADGRPVWLYRIDGAPDRKKSSSSTGGRRKPG